MAFLIRILVLALIVYLIYRFVRHMSDPRRKLDAAIKAKTYYLSDDIKNPRKNFFLAYKGVLFEGEKYTGPEENAFRVVSIFVWTHELKMLMDFAKEDFDFLEQEIRKNYPDAAINWKNPIEQLMKKGG
ncbi:sigma-w pathway protein ysdB [Planomicrobium sp. CPCC 101079]|uniref:sigma-w pathway protein ysdB n=1 Tax=Planomicrobium sp. CPCC 101079 TaxID=2599618 RepID=UPI0011B390F7|nr:sigma-w pathway protein ysdB [Planomicrobium sp. CPCC 101079]TWT08951.1 sigma-w pathway protein ysdB [Planomicrobium sp. CPCC 101079]